MCYDTFLSIVSMQFLNRTLLTLSDENENVRAMAAQASKRSRVELAAEEWGKAKKEREFCRSLSDEPPPFFSAV